MAVITYNGHTSRAKDWYEKENIFFIVGGQTPWPDEDLPPVEEEDQTILDPLGFVRCEQKLYVIPDPDGEIYYHRDNYSIVPDEQIYDARCRWVLMQSYLNYDDFPLGTYRVLGISTNVQPAEGSELKQVLLPSEVANLSDVRVDIVSNDTATTRSATKRELIQCLVEF